MNAVRTSNPRTLGPIAGLAASVLMIGGCAFNPNERIGFPAIVTTSTNTVNIDGLATEGFWGQSSKIFLEDGSSNSAAFMRGMADATNIYLYFEVADTLNPEDVVVLAFNPTGNANDFHRLDIYPCPSGVCIPSPTGLVPTVESWTGSLAGSGVLGAPPPGILISANSASGVGSRWSVEVQIPRSMTPYAFPANGFFGMFADIIKTDPTTFLATQYSWPLNTPIGSNQNSVNISLVNANLRLLRWGTGTLDTSTFPTGLQITGFNNTGTDPSRISWSNTPPNEFTATVANNPTGTGGADATNVTASFRIANWGITGFNPVPATPVPATGQTIHANEYVPFSSGVWMLNSAEQTYWSTPGNQHACIEVMINHAFGSFTRQFNMVFVNVNSPFEGTPQIATGAWRRRYRQAQRVILNEEFVNTERGFTWESRFDGAAPAGEHRWVIESMARPTERLRTSVLPSPTLLLPSQEYQLNPVALSQGGTMDIPVRPNSVLTLLADGEATSGGTRYTAAGMSETPARHGLTVRRNPFTSAENERYAQSDQEQTPRIADVLRPGSSTRRGALIASFDGFRTAFAIGSGVTMFVPSNAQRLSVRFAPGVSYDGGAIVLQAVATDANALALDGIPLERLRDARMPVLLQLGINLPMHIVHGTLETGRFITIRDRQFRVGVPIGAFGEMVQRVNRPHAQIEAPAGAPAPSRETLLP